MGSFRFALTVLGFFAFQLLLLPWIPLLRLIVDPIFLFLVFLGLKVPSIRFLWVYGLLLGSLKDLTTGGLFGIFSLSFSLVGAIFGMSRHLVEWEAPLNQGILTGLLTGLAGMMTCFVVSLADRSAGCPGMSWMLLPVSMVAHGWIATWGFPKLEKIIVRVK